MSVQTYSLAMIGLLQVEYSAWWYALVSLSVYYPKVCSQCSPQLSLACKVKKRTLFRVKGKGFILAFLPKVRTRNPIFTLVHIRGSPLLSG